MLTCFIGPDAKTASFLGCSLSGMLQVAVQVRSSIFKKKKKKNPTNYMLWKPSKILWCTFPVWGGFTWSSQTRDVNPRQDGNTDAAAGLWRSKPALGLGCAPRKPGGDAQFAVVVNDMHCSGAARVSPRWSHAARWCWGTAFPLTSRSGEPAGLSTGCSPSQGPASARRVQQTPRGEIREGELRCSSLLPHRVQPFTSLLFGHSWFALSCCSAFCSRFVPWASPLCLHAQNLRISLVCACFHKYIAINKPLPIL